MAIAAHDLFEIPENLRATIRAVEAGLDSAKDDPSVTTEGAVTAWYEALKAPLDQLRFTAEYLSDTAKFDTHHGVKGREFPRVMVVMDDEEARGFTFSFDKLFEVVSKSESDMRREAKGEETSTDQTRRLFYVTCSRAESSLALVLYSENPSLARKFLLDKNWFSEDEIQFTQ
jgi:DNA helicase-2/ATP-dependent DNA helicase PcrA